MSSTSLFFSTLPLAIFGCLIPLTAIAQISADGTTSTTVNQVGNDFTIEQGDRIDDNLFHSFKEFSVPTLGSAAFNNASNIANIFSRVTGSNISSIDGLISANGAANLFLINPNGIIFGENARLNLGGSFFASTADSLLFEGNREFSASNPQAAPLLEVNIPIGINFRDNPGDIVNQATGDGLEVAPGENLTLVGGDIEFEAGKATARGGNIELGGLSAAGKVGIGEDNNLSFPNDVAKANIFFTNNAVVDITSDGGGSITVNADNLDLTGESLFLAGIGEDLGSENAVAGTIQIDATRIFADNGSQIRSDNLGIGQAGIVNINTDTLDFDNNSAIVVSTFGQGDAGTVNITAQDVSFEQEWGGIYSSVGLSRIATEERVVDAKGDGGEINIDTNTFSLMSGASILVNSVAQGDAGNINISATGEVSFSGVGDTPVPAFEGGMVISGTSSQVQFAGVGNSGQINIEADSLNLDTGAVFVDNSGEKGDAGEITLDIQNNISLDQGALIDAQVLEGTIGNGGAINIAANSYESKGGSSVLADNQGIGDGGNINIDIEETISLNERSLIQTELGEEAVGKAGGITITANSLILNSSSDIIAQTEGQGDAGEISINANEAISLNQSQISSQVSQVNSSATGNGANISLTGGELNLTNKSRIIANTDGQSANPNDISTAGDIDLDITGDINLDHGSQIQSQVGVDAVGNAGNITINTDGSLISTNDSQILTGSEGNGNGGKIQITAGDSIQVSDNSLILANTSEQSIGNAGKITLEAGNTFSLSESLVLSQIKDEAEGNAGNIEITAGDSINLRDQSTLLANVSEQGIGDAGKITLEAGNTFSLSDESSVLSQIQDEAEGNAGDIEITANTIDINNFSLVSTNAQKGTSGEAGSINLNGTNISIKSGSVVDALTENGFKGGNIEISGGNLKIVSGGVIVTSATSGGNAGSINLDLTGDITINGEGTIPRPKDAFPLREQVLNDLQESTGLFATTLPDSTDDEGSASFLSGATIRVFPEAVGNAGGVSIEAGSLTLTNGGEVNASTFGEGNAGNVTINSDSVELTDSSQITTLTCGEGNAGDLAINADSVKITDSLLITETLGTGEGTGDAGSVNIDVTNGGAFNISNSSIATDTTGEGKAGDLDISAGSVDITDSSLLITETSGTGNAGSVTIDVTNGGAFNISNSLISTGTIGEGNADNLDISAGSVKITDSTAITSLTFGEGKAGDIDISGDSVKITDSSSISAETSGAGNTGNIDITTSQLSVEDGGQVSASTKGPKNAGNILINTTELIDISNKDSGIFATTSLNSTGKGGNITIGIFDSEGKLDTTQFTEKITLSNQGTITADSNGTGSGGAITIRAEDLNLLNTGKISATTDFIQEEASPLLSAINLFVEDNLILRNGSKISAEATNSADGGNVNIDAEFIIAFPPKESGSDILANAGEGKGGNINIITKGIFGIEERPLNLFTNDINASSEFGLGGTISISTSDFNPTSGLIELPEAVGDATDQISQNICEQGVGSEFIITGKGGLPPNPNEILNSDEEQVGLVEPVPLQREAVGANGIRPESLRPERPTSELELVPAQGWIFNDKGEVTLTSYRTPNTEIGTPKTEIKPSPQQKFNGCPASMFENR